MTSATLTCCRLCFIYCKKKDEFVATVLDPSISDVRLAEKGRELMGRKRKSPKSSLQSSTFQDLDGCSLQFAPQSLHRPFRRALNFQATVARRWAIMHDWKPLSWDFEDFSAEGLDVSEKMRLWLFGDAHENTLLQPDMQIHKTGLAG